MDTLQILFSSCDSLINQLQKQVEEEQEEEKEESTKSNQHSSSPAGPDQTK